MDETMLYRSLEKIFADIFLLDEIKLTAHTVAGDVEGWDSFKQIEIIMAVESYFGIKLRAREIDGMRNVGDLAALVLNKIQTNGIA